MKIIPTDIQGVIEIEPQVLADHRGWFIETYSRFKLTGFGIDLEFVQDNHEEHS